MQDDLARINYYNKRQKLIINLWFYWYTHYYHVYFRENVLIMSLAKFLKVEILKFQVIFFFIKLDSLILTFSAKIF